MEEIQKDKKNKITGKGAKMKLKRFFYFTLIYFILRLISNMNPYGVHKTTIAASVATTI
jgi:hypothetical protein